MGKISTNGLLNDVSFTFKPRGVGMQAISFEPQIGTNAQDDVIAPDDPAQRSTVGCGRPDQAAAG